MIDQHEFTLEHILLIRKSKVRFFLDAFEEFQLEL
jgi:hypothetical protein